MLDKETNKVIISRNVICLNKGESEILTNVYKSGDCNKRKKTILNLNDDDEIKSVEEGEDFKENKDVIIKERPKPNFSNLPIFGRKQK